MLTLTQMLGICCHSLIPIIVGIPLLGRLYNLYWVDKNMRLRKHDLPKATLLPSVRIRIPTQLFLAVSDLNPLGYDGSEKLGPLSVPWGKAKGLMWSGLSLVPKAEKRKLGD